MAEPAVLLSGARVDGDSVFSPGVLDEIAPQTQETMNFMLDLPLENRRRATNVNATYPWHGEQDLSCLHGQWAFTSAGASGGYGATHDALPPIFTVANGLSLGTPIRFTGIVDKTVIAGENKDPSVSVTVGGIRTGVNTSNKLIPNNFLVIWDWPTIRQHRGGVGMPNFRQKGIPETAFMFRTLPLRRGRVFDIIRSITVSFFQACYSATGTQYRSNRMGWDDVRAQLVNANGAAMRAQVKSSMRDAHKQDVIVKSTSDTRDILKRYVNFLLAMIGDTTVDFFSHTHEADPSDLFGDSDGQFAESSIYARSMNEPGARRIRPLLSFDSDAERNTLMANAPTAFIEYPVKFAIELITLLNQRLMGKCMQTSDAGGRLDLLMHRVSV